MTSKIIHCILIGYIALLRLHSHPSLCYTLGLMSRKGGTRFFLNKFKYSGNTKLYKAWRSVNSFGPIISARQKQMIRPLTFTQSICPFLVMFIFNLIQIVTQNKESPFPSRDLSVNSVVSEQDCTVVHIISNKESYNAYWIMKIS